MATHTTDSERTAPGSNQQVAEQRRRAQLEAGLLIQEVRVEMDHQVQNRNPQNRPHRESRAHQTLERLTAPPTFAEVAMHELKKAAVWVPIGMSCAFTLMWANKKFFIRAALPGA